MKTNLWKIAAALFIGAAVAVSCEDPVKPDETPEQPNFPELQTVTLEKGQSCNVTIAPNYDWEVAISGDTEHFELRYNDEPVPVARGKKGEYTLTVTAKEGEDFEQRKVELTMTMESEDKLIAEIHRNGKERIFNVYAVKVDENGKFSYAEDGSYEYEEVPTSDVSLSYVESYFQTYIKVVANFDWRLKDVPEWVHVNCVDGYYVDAAKANETGIVSLRGVNPKYPLGGAEGELVFIIDDNSENPEEVDSDINITLPKVEDIFEVSLPAAGNFDMYGDLYNEGLGEYVSNPLRGEIVCAGGVSVYAFENGVQCDWVEISVTCPEGEDVLKSHSVRIGVTENGTGADRSADVYFIPETVTLGSPADALNHPEYKACTINQKGDNGSQEGDLVIADPDALAAQGASLEHVSPYTNWIAEADKIFGVGADNYYELTVSKLNGFYYLSYGFEFWDFLRYEDNAGTIVESKGDWGYVGESYTQIYLSEEEAANTHYLVIRENADPSEEKLVNKVVIAVTYDPSIEGGETLLAFAYPAETKGASLRKMNAETDGEDLHYQAAYSEIGKEQVYELVYGPNVKMPFLQFSVNAANVYYPYEDDDWLSYEEGMILMNSTYLRKGIVVFSDSGNVPVLAVVCKYDPDFTGSTGGDTGGSIEADAAELEYTGSVFKKLKDDSNYGEGAIPVLEDAFGIGEDNYYLLTVSSPENIFHGFTYPHPVQEYSCFNMDWDTNKLVESTNWWATYDEEASLSLNMTEVEPYSFNFLSLRYWPSDDAAEPVTFAVILVVYEPEE